MYENYFRLLRNLFNVTYAHIITAGTQISTSWECAALISKSHQFSPFFCRLFPFFGEKIIKRTNLYKTFKGSLCFWKKCKSNNHPRHPMECNHKSLNWPDDRISSGSLFGWDGLAIKSCTLLLIREKIYIHIYDERIWFIALYSFWSTILTRKFYSRLRLVEHALLSGLDN